MSISIYGHIVYLLLGINIIQKSFKDQDIKHRIINMRITKEAETSIIHKLLAFILTKATLFETEFVSYTDFLAIITLNSNLLRLMLKQTSYICITHAMVYTRPKWYLRRIWKKYLNASLGWKQIFVYLSISYSFDS